MESLVPPEVDRPFLAGRRLACPTRLRLARGRRHARPDKPTPDGVPTIAVPAAEPVRFADMKLIRPLAEAIDHAGYKYPHAGPGGRDPAGDARQGRDRPGPDRHRQDGRVPDPVHEPLAAAQAQGPDRPGHVARPANWPCKCREEAEKLAPSRRFRTVAVYGGAGMGRQLDGPRPRLRPRRRHPGPDARPPPPRVDVAGQRPLRRPRRGRPDARHRLPPGHRADPPPLPDRSGRRCSCRPPCRTRSSGWSTAT